MAKITYTDKTTLNPQPSIAEVNKVTATDMNEIKSVVNGLIVNSDSTSQEDTYSSDYLNTKFATFQNIPVTLYNNTSGTTGQVNLSETSANFTYIEIFFKTNDNDYGSIKVYQPNGKKVAIFVNHPTGTTQNTTNYMKSRILSISGTTMTTTGYSEIAINHSASPTIAQTNNIYVVRVIGYR